MTNKVATPDAEIAQIAARQHGVITAAQLAEIGLSRASVSERARSGRLHSLHRGVYAVGHAGLSLEGRWRAAVLACGEGAALSHAAAAALWGFLRPIDGAIDVTVPTNNGRARRPGIRLHRCRSLGPERSKATLLGHDEQSRHAPLVTVCCGIPVTTPGRTIEDLRGSVAPHLVRRATRQAELAGWRIVGGGDRTRSDLEGAFLSLCRRNGLPRPEVNARIGRWTVDFLWPRARLAVETDSWGTHRGSVAFEDDRRRDLDLRRAGYSVRRYSGAQIRDLPAAVVADLRAALAPRRGR